MCEIEYGYLHHGSGMGPFSSERVKIKHEMPDNWFAFYEGNWRKVHVKFRRLYIVFKGEKITIQIDGV